MRTRWFTIETLKGDPISVGSRTLVPIARRIVLRIGLDGHAGGGARVEHIEPIGVVEKIEAVEKRVPIEDATGAALRSVLIGGVLIGALAWLARTYLARRKARP